MNGQGIVPVDGELHEAVETVDFPEGGFRGILSGCFWCFGGKRFGEGSYLRCKRSWNRFKLRIKATITVAMAAACPKFKIEKPT